MKSLFLFGIAAMCTVSLLVQCNQRTKKPSDALYGIHNGHAYVDLGLCDGHGNRILFATMSVGAESETDFGDFFAWGETSKRYASIDSDGSIIGATFEWNNPPFYNGSAWRWTKYTGSDDDVLLAADDVASVLWGGEWRMPDKEELQKLVDECDFAMQEDYNGSGKSGILFTGPSGASLFLPAAGFCYRGDWYGAGYIGSYWSRSLSTYPDWACFLYFVGSGDQTIGDNVRSYGLSVRPVLVLPE